MKKTFLISISLFLTFTLTQGQNYIQTTSSSSNSNSTITHKANLVLGDQQTSSTSRPLQIYYNDPNKNFATILGNGSGRWEFCIAGGNGAYHQMATAGTGVIRKLGQHSMIFSMPNSNMTNPNYDTTNWNSSGITSIRFADAVNLNSLLIYNTGKVTMGTSKYDNDSNYRLYVKDGIKTERVKVEVASTNGWADYVFKENYELTSLKEVELFIKKNKHLPEIPNEDEVLKNGIELKAMNILLLKKIEELTLYTIQQQKLIDNMKEDLDGLKNNK